MQRSVNRLPLAEGVLAARAAQLDSWRQRVQQLTRCQGMHQTAEHKLAAIEREAGQAALKAEELALRFGLTGEVPCVGSELQGRCKLLGDARQAQVLIPSARAAIHRLAPEKSAVQQELQSLRTQLEGLVGALQALS